MSNPHHPLLWGLGLTGAGWHPAAARSSTVPARDVFTAEYWQHQISAADRAGLDLLSIDHSFALQTSRAVGADGRPDQILGRFDAVRLAGRAAPDVRRVGLLPQVELGPDRALPAVEPVAQLVRAAPGRIGMTLDLSGRAVLPRTPDAVCRWVDQVAALADVDWRPVVAVTATGPAGERVAERTADVVFTRESTPQRTAERAARWRQRTHRRESRGPVRVLADLVVVLDDDPAAAVRRWSDWTAGYGPLTGPVLPVHLGSPDTLLDELDHWADSGIDGVRFRVGSVERDLPMLLETVLPALSAADRRESAA